MLRSAVDGYLRTVTELPAGEQASAVQRLRAAAGVDAGLLRPMSAALTVLLDPPRLAAEDRHEQFIAAVAAFLTGLAAEHGGLLLVLDDVQWLDVTSRAVLRQLADQIAQVPVLVLATARDDQPGSAGLAAFDADVGTRLDLRVPVGPLDDAGMNRLISGYLAGSDVSREMVEELAVRGGGNPFTTLEYLHALIEAGALRPSWGTWELTKRSSRRSSCPPRCSTWSSRASTGSAALPAASWRWPPPSAPGSTPACWLRWTGRTRPPHWSEAAAAGLLHPEADRYVFRHDRVREALLSGGRSRRTARPAPADSRGSLDTRARTDAADVYALADHYANGEVDRTPERVFATGWAAGQLAVEESAPAAALLFLQTAATAAQRAGIALDSSFREVRAVAYLWGGNADSAREQLEQGLAGERDRLRRATLLLHLAHAHRLQAELTARWTACARASRNWAPRCPPTRCCSAWPRRRGCCGGW